MQTLAALAYAFWESLPYFLSLAIVWLLAVICDEARSRYEARKGRG